MWQQKSYREDAGGILYLVPTPVGNLEDMTFRAIRMLKEADLIAAEDTRQTKKLLNYFEIATPLTSYHEHNKEHSGERLIEDLKAGKQIALVTDAGMPGISDPGYDLVVACVKEQLTVVPLPGANAALPALVGSGLNTQQFTFYGFLPRGKKERKEELDILARYPSTLIFYEAPHRLKETLKAMAAELGNRHAAVVRELSKKYEEFSRGTLDEIVQYFEQADAEIRGEFCIIIEGARELMWDKEEEWWVTYSLTDHVEHYINEGMKSKEAIKKAADDRGLPKREVYQAYHIEME